MSAVDGHPDGDQGQAGETRCHRGHLLTWCAGCGDGICDCDPSLPGSPLCWSCK